MGKFRVALGVEEQTFALEADPNFVSPLLTFVVRSNHGNSRSSFVLLASVMQSSDQTLKIFLRRYTCIHKVRVRSVNMPIGGEQ